MGFGRQAAAPSSEQSEASASLIIRSYIMAAAVQVRFDAENTGQDCGYFGWLFMSIPGNRHLRTETPNQ